MFTHSLNYILVDLRFSALPFGNENNRHFHGLENSKHLSASHGYIQLKRLLQMRNRFRNPKP